jgi:hypothetical protein
MHTITRAYFTVLAQALVQAGAPVDPQDTLPGAGGVTSSWSRSTAGWKHWYCNPAMRTWGYVHAHAHPAMLGQLGFAVMSCATVVKPCSAWRLTIR